MNVLPATKNPLATQEIGGMEDMIGKLIESGHAYVAKDGTVYFRVKSFKDYGKLSHKNIDELQSGFREIKVTGEDGKEDSNDFVLWKPKKDGEPFWDSPWSKGRPGWHIECSVMSKKYLGDQIDIHGGGEDLIFPHHENEIAQSESASGKSFANYWMHNAFLNIDNKKMSKSAGNFFTVRDISKKYDLQVLRFFMLSAHYRSPLNFSADLMEAAKNSLERILTGVDNIKAAIQRDNKAPISDAELSNLEIAKVLKDKYGKLWITSRGNYATIAPDVRVATLKGHGYRVTDSLQLPLSGCAFTPVGDTLLYYSTVYSYATKSTTISYDMLSVTGIVPLGKSFITDGTEGEIVTPYGLAVNPETGDILIADAKDYKQSGELFCYNRQGRLKWRVQTGDIPGHMAFVRR